MLVCCVLFLADVHIHTLNRALRYMYCCVFVMVWVAMLTVVCVCMLVCFGFSGCVCVSCYVCLSDCVLVCMICLCVSYFKLFVMCL